MLASIKLSANIRSVIVACVFIAGAARSSAGVLGDYDLPPSRPGQAKPKAFVALLCASGQAKRLIQEAHAMGIKSSADLILAMRLLWCSVDEEADKRLKVIQDRVALPFNYVSAGHQHLVEAVNDIQSAVGSLRFGELPRELEVNVLSKGTEITFRTGGPQLDDWKMKLTKDRWQLQSMSLCDCGE